MGLVELHMVCEAEEESGLIMKSEMHTELWVPTPPQFTCLPHLLQVPEEEVIVFIQKPCKGEHVEGEGVPTSRPTEPSSIRFLTSHAVGHLSRIMKKAELPSVEGFPGLLVSKLVPEDNKNRKLQISDLGMPMPAEEALRAIQEGASRPLGRPTNCTPCGRLRTPACCRIRRGSERQTNLSRDAQLRELSVGTWLGPAKYYKHWASFTASGQC